MHIALKILAFSFDYNWIKRNLLFSFQNLNEAKSLSNLCVNFTKKN